MWLFIMNDSCVYCKGSMRQIKWNLFWKYIWLTQFTDPLCFWNNSPIPIELHVTLFLKRWWLYWANRSPCLQWTQRFTAIFTNACHWSIPWTSSVYFTCSHPIYVMIDFIIIQSTHKTFSVVTSSEFSDLNAEQISHLPLQFGF